MIKAKVQLLQGNGKKKVTEKLPCGKVQNENGDFNKTEVGG